MNKGVKYYIQIFKNGSLVGYIKGVSYTNCSYRKTEDKTLARGFSEVELFDIIDFLVKVDTNGYSFAYTI